MATPVQQLLSDGRYVSKVCGMHASVATSVRDAADRNAAAQAVLEEVKGVLSSGPPVSSFAVWVGPVMGKAYAEFSSTGDAFAEGAFDVCVGLMVDIIDIDSKQATFVNVVKDRSCRDRLLQALYKCDFSPKG